MAKSRLDMRREAEAVAARDEAAPAKKKVAKKAAAKKPTRRKAKVADRKRLSWGVFSGTLKEEARFPYDQRAAADEKLELLRSKGKKLYFIQPIKEVITDGTARPKPTLEDDEEFEMTPRARRAAAKREREAEEEEEMPEPLDDLDMGDDDE
jgi:hypothetical protein